MRELARCSHSSVVVSQLPSRSLSQPGLSDSSGLTKKGRLKKKKNPKPNYPKSRVPRSWSTAATDSLEELVPVGHLPGWSRVERACFGHEREFSKARLQVMVTCGGSFGIPIATQLRRLWELLSRSIAQWLSLLWCRPRLNPPSSAVTMSPKSPQALHAIMQPLFEFRSWFAT